MSRTSFAAPGVSAKVCRAGNAVSLAAREDELGFGDDLGPFRFADHSDAELLSLLEF